MGDGDSITNEGHLHPEANPWAQQVFSDLVFAYRSSEEFRDMVPEDFPLLRLFYCDDYDDWTDIDFTIIRA
eukprot:3459322-Pyramimonas_sp.AAC.1